MSADWRATCVVCGSAPRRFEFVAFSYGSCRVIDAKTGDSLARATRQSQRGGRLPQAEAEGSGRAALY